MSEAIPWAHWLRLASWLGVAPHHFWRLSLRKWRALLGPHGGDVLRRQELSVLMDGFPDQERVTDE